MSDVLTDLQSPRWWFSVVIAGIVVNITASYLLRFIDRRLVNTFGWWRRRRASVRTDRLATLATLRGDRQKQVLLAAAELRSRFRSLVYLVEAIGMAVLSVLFLSVGAPAWVTTPAIGLFAILWYVFVIQSRFAEHASELLAELHRESQ